MTLCRAVVYQPGDIIVPAADGSRKLTVRISGNPSGIPVFFLHGTPGSRIGPAPRTPVLYKLGVRLISFDRPGYGGSERQVARRVADAAEDVVAIADYLEVEQFAVLGRSGGGPHALACAALLPDRVTRAGVLVSLAPWEGMGAQWLNGMSISNRLEYTAAALEPEKLITRLVQSAAKIKADPTSHVTMLGREMPEDDRRVVADAGIRALLAQNFAEALKDSADGWIDDALAFCAPWGFDPADIMAPVLLWHGGDDVFSPVAHTHWLADKIKVSEVVIKPRTAHFGALEAVPWVLSWLIRTDLVK
jgi:pimeloyl-ACP methyl ester carboxylesterase